MTIPQLTRHVWAFHALSAVAESGLLAALDEPHTLPELAAATGVDPEVAGALLDVLAAVDLVTLAQGRYAVAPELSAPGLRAELRSVRLQGAAMVERARGRRLRDLAWDHADPDLLQAQGDLSVGGGPRLTARLHLLDGIPERVASGTATLLDVGTGVAAMPIAACREVPGLRVVGLEPHPPSAELAERNVAAAGLASRVELRRERVEDLRERERYDVVHLPLVFMADDVVVEALPRVHAALRPGGWLLTGTLALDGPGLSAAVSRLRARLWGSDALTREALRALLEDAGFDPIRSFDGGGTLHLFTARRAA
jgi:predicted O-methyltransferase YrrM